MPPLPNKKALKYRQGPPWLLKESVSACQAWVSLPNKRETHRSLTPYATAYLMSSGTLVEKIRLTRTTYFV